MANETDKARSLRDAALGMAALVMAASVWATACDESSAVKEPIRAVDAGQGSSGGPGLDSGSDAGFDGGPSDCFINPTTHDEIINACTDAVKITKNPSLPLLLADGGLPPLP